MRTLLITGTNRGIGLEMTKQYAAEGWRVLACCRLPQAANALQQLKETYANIDIFQLDVKEPSAIQSLSKQLHTISIDMLINNAGVWGPEQQEFGCTDPNAWIDVFKVNTIAPLLLAEAFLPHIEQSQLKMIVNIDSTMGSIALNDSGSAYIYRSTKAALNAVTKSMAIDLNSRGITVVALHPGWVKTDMGGSHAKITPEESVNGIRNVLSQLSFKDSGTFWGYDHQPLPW